MLQFERRRIKNLDDEPLLPINEYLTMEVKKEIKEEKEFESSDMENSTPHLPPLENPIVPEHINVEVKDLNNFQGLEEKVFSEVVSSEKITKNCEGHQKSQADKIEQIYSYLHPSYLQTSDLSHLNLSINSDPTVQQIRKGKQRVLKDSFLLLHCQPWEIEKILKRREENRKRKVEQRAKETKEQRISRREKERLAKAVSRASEPQEKKLARRKRDRIAKALSRAAESEEQRRLRREKNRIAMATLRAKRTEEERFMRRERDRMKKARIRAFETEEQKRLRREKNRVAMAMRRANLNKQERAYLRKVNRMAKAGSRSSEILMEVAFGKAVNSPKES